MKNTKVGKAILGQYIATDPGDIHQSVRPDRCYISSGKQISIIASHVAILRKRCDPALCLVRRGTHIADFVANKVLNGRRMCGEILAVDAF